MKTLRTFLIVALVGVAAIGGWLYAGGLDVAADSPHSEPVYALVSWARDRSVVAHATDIKPPPLDDPKQIAAGASEYGEMCQGCHLGPGIKSDEFRDGLYPQPPNLSEDSSDPPSQTWWVIKHGIKGSAMPAWGRSHSDETLWAITAFLQQLPTLTPEQYQQMTANAAEHHQEMHPDAPAGSSPAPPANTEPRPSGGGS